jgi:hypothetical protein
MTKYFNLSTKGALSDGSVKPFFANKGDPPSFFKMKKLYDFQLFKELSSVFLGSETSYFPNFSETKEKHFCKGIKFQGKVFRLLGFSMFLRPVIFHFQLIIFCVLSSGVNELKIVTVPSFSYQVRKYLN